MRFNIKHGAGLVGALLLACAPQAATGAPTKITDEGVFNGVGNVTQTTSFGGFDVGTSVLLANPYVDGALSVSADTLVGIGSSFLSYNNVSGGIIDDAREELTFSISETGFNMLSFKAANLFGDEDTTISLFTNQGLYAKGLADHSAQAEFPFHGFILPLGEYFTGFTLKANGEGSSLLMVSEVELGVLCATRSCEAPPMPCDKIGGCTPTGPVPEPSAWALMILGFGAAGAALRSHRRRRLSPA